jgi:hypothetical protein
MVVKMKTPKAQEGYKQRQQMVEPAIGDIKENEGLRAFLASDIQGAKREPCLACAANNRKKIGRVKHPTFPHFTPTLDSVIREQALTSLIKGEEPIRSSCINLNI